MKHQKWEKRPNGTVDHFWPRNSVRTAELKTNLTAQLAQTSQTSSDVLTLRVSLVVTCKSWHQSLHFCYFPAMKQRQLSCRFSPNSWGYRQFEPVRTRTFFLVDLFCGSMLYVRCWRFHTSPSVRTWCCHCHGGLERPGHCAPIGAAGGGHCSDLRAKNPAKRFLLEVPNYPPKHAMKNAHFLGFIYWNRTTLLQPGRNTRAWAPSLLAPSNTLAVGITRVIFGTRNLSAMTPEWPANRLYSHSSEIMDQQVVLFNKLRTLQFC